MKRPNVAARLAHPAYLARKVEVWASVVWLGIAEAFSAYGDPRIGSLLHAGLLLTCVARAAFGGESNQAMLTVALLPLIRILSLGQPPALARGIALYPLVSIPLMVGTLVAARANGLCAAEVGLRAGRLPDQLVIGLGGVLLGALERQIIPPSSLAVGSDVGQVLLAAASLMLFTGFSEELLFRGVLLPAMVKTVGQSEGLIFTSLVFGLMHTGWLSVPDIGFATVVGFLFGAAAIRTRSIAGVSLAHGLANVVLFLALA